MLIGDLKDTILNLTAFAFVGAMIWLMVRPLAKPEPEGEDCGAPDDRSKKTLPERQG